jgi:hypothetical protein
MWTTKSTKMQDEQAKCEQQNQQRCKMNKRMTKKNQWNQQMKLIQYILGEECCGLMKFTTLAKILI